MEELLHILRERLNSHQAKILLRALKNSTNEDFFNFVLKNMQIICTWLNSKDFKEHYASHPYPPLINPDFVDTDASRYCAQLAWDLNLPLPKRYKFIYISPHGSGAAAFLRYLNSSNVLCFASWVLPCDAKQRYCIDFMCLNDEKITQYAINISELHLPFFDKYLSLLDRNSKLICAVRDPIGLLKHSWGRDWTKVERNYPRTFNLTYDWRHYIDFLTHKNHPIKINTEELHHSVFIIDFLLTHFNEEHVHYVDMEEIKPKNSFLTMQNLAPKFDFTPPHLHNEFLFKIKEFRGYIRYLFPLTLYANEEDLNSSIHSNNMCNLDSSKSIALILDRPHKNLEKLNIIEQILRSDLCNDVGVYIDRADLMKLEKRPLFFKKIKNYLHEFLVCMEKTIDQSQDVMMKEGDVLLYFEQNPSLALEFKKIFEKEYKKIQQYRPDIINSWKYYKKFKNICDRIENL